MNIGISNVQKTSLQATCTNTTRLQECVLAEIGELALIQYERPRHF